MDSDAFDPRLDEVIQCPYPHYARLRALDPVHHLPGELIGRPGEEIYAVAGYELVATVLNDWRTYSSRFGTTRGAPPPHLQPALEAISARGWERPPTMLHADPPAHTRYRKLVSKAFSPRRVAELAPTIVRICRDLCDAMDAGDGRVELVSEFAGPIPARTIATALGVPEERYTDFKRWADAEIAAIGRQLDDESWLASARGIVELQRYFAAELEARRADPRDDLLTDLLHVRLTADDEVEGEPLSMEEMISIVQQLQVAGSETTANLISAIVLLLDQRPDEWDRVTKEPDRAGSVVEDALRLASPNQGSFRVVMADTELGGVLVPKGSTLWLLFGSANHDQAAYDHPEELDPDRSSLYQHLAFGRGPHYCIGAPLARLEATIALQILTSRYERVDVLDPGSLRYAPSWILRGLERLDVQLVCR